MRMFFAFFLFLQCVDLMAQDSLALDSVTSINSFDTIQEIEVSNHSPMKAGIYSAVLPGMGQVYNEKVWKVPVIYAALGGAAYFIIDNGKEKKTYQEAIEIRFDDDPNTIDQFDGVFNDQDLIRIRNTFRQRQDLSILVGGLFYALNIIDAVVDAHLFDFEVGDDLGLAIQPAFQYDMASRHGISSLRLSLSLK